MTANSAFHGSRLDVTHIRDVMEDVIARAENRWGINRHQIAPNTVFVSHETYTPARGGSAQAEVDALRHVFGSSADSIVIANTKGFTGHAMGVGIEDVLAIKSLETGIVPPIANVKETDPDLGPLNLSKGGAYPVTYALRLGAGFGSQISMSLLRWVPSPDGRHREPDELGFEYRVNDPEAWRRWLAEVSGYESAELETVQRTLRVRDDGPPSGIAVHPERSVEHAPEVISSPPAVAPTPAAVSAAASTDAAPATAPAPAAAPVARGTRPRSRPVIRWWRWCCRWWPNRPATPPTCSSSNSTSKPTWASTPSNKPKPSPPSATTTASNATTTCPYATTPPSPTSSTSSATAPTSPMPAEAAAPAAASAPAAPAPRGTRGTRRGAGR